MTPRSTLRLLPAATLLLFAACSGESDDDGPDIVGTRDGGVTTDRDAGETPRDGGETSRDGGPPRDGGPSTTGPIDAPFDTWTWVDVPDSRCMNQTPSGFGINIHEGATKVFIYMQGGDACFNAASCSITFNLDGYGANKFASEPVLGVGLFDRGAAQNYFRDWSYVYIPYCSGDVFAGTAGSTNVQGSSYYFNGFNNVGLYLDRIVPTFPDADQVVISGFSAGGFGALLNFERTQTAFGANVDVTLIDDSGPPMSSAYLAPCLQEHWMNTWGIDAGPLSTCNGCIAPDGSFVEGYLDHLKTTYPNNRFGVISSNADDTIRGFFGYGNNDCANLMGIPTNFPAARFQMGLEDFRDNLVGDVDNFKLYMPMSTRHVWSTDPLWNVQHYGVTLQDWYVGAIEDSATWDNVP